jgi:glycosyltransferase involved in cell wall biosynthesis
MNIFDSCVEVLIPTYNRCDRLKIAVQSVLDQDHKNLKITVIDNASTDKTEKFVKDLVSKDSRVNYIKHEKNIGMLKNFKYAFSIVSEDYFCFLPDDDMYANNFIKDALQVFSSNQNLGFVALKVDHIDHDGRNFNIASNNHDESIHIYKGLDSFKYMSSFKFPLTIISVMYKKPLANLYVNYDNCDDKGSDIKYLLMCSAQFSWATYSKVGAYVTTHDDSFSVSKNVVDWQHEVIKNLRYVDIINNHHIDKNIREYAKSLLALSLNDNRVSFYFFSILRKILIGIRDNKSSSFCKDDIKEFERCKKYHLTLFLKFFNNFAINRKFIGALIKVYKAIKSILNNIRSS